MQKDLYPSFTDPRDGKVYRTVKIGDQIWMAENLNYNAPGSRCYNNDPKNAEEYGRLYDWKTAMETCPPGWHLPTNKEWSKLIKAIGGKDTTDELPCGKDHGVLGMFWLVAKFSFIQFALDMLEFKPKDGIYLKAKFGWDNYDGGESGNGLDEYGFAALPGGSGGNPVNIGKIGHDGYWWSASEYGANRAYCRIMQHTSNYMAAIFINKSQFFSVRCVVQSTPSYTPKKHTPWYSYTHIIFISIIFIVCITIWLLYW